MKTVLLLALLCLAGCKSEEAPYLEVSTDKTEVDCTEETLTVTVSSNGSWRTVLDKGNTYIGSMEGEGPGTVIFELPGNKTYDDVIYTLNTQSTDGSMSDTKTILQKASIGLEVKGISQIPEGGATVDIPVKTNDNITSVETPDWITFTSSRALTSYTYTFKVEPNKTGAVRKGTVRFKGNATEKAVEVTQDSYAPTGVSFKDDLSFVTAESFGTGILLEPEYADPSKLTVKTSGNCKASIENGELNVTLTDYGTYSITIFSYNQEIAKVKGERVAPNPFYEGETQEAYLGQSDFLKYRYYSKDYTLRSSNPGVVAIGSDGKPRAVGTGTATITATHPKVDCYGTQTVKVEPFLLESRIGIELEKSNGIFDVRFAARVEGPAGMSCDGFVVTDRNGYVKILDKGNFKYHMMGETGCFYTIATDAISVSRNGYHNVEEALEGYRMMVQTTINGKTYQRTVPINTRHVAFY